MGGYYKCRMMQQAVADEYDKVLLELAELRAARDSGSRFDIDEILASLPPPDLSDPGVEGGNLANCGGPCCNPELPIREVSEREAADLYQNACRKWFNMTSEEFEAASAQNQIEQDTAKAHLVNDLRRLNGEESQ